MDEREAVSSVNVGKEGYLIWILPVQRLLRVLPLKQRLLRGLSPEQRLLRRVLPLPLLARRRGYDVVFLPAANRRAPVWAGAPSVGTVHDFSSLHVRGKYDPAR